MPDYYIEYSIRADQIKVEIHEIMNELAIEEMYIDELVKKLKDAKRRLDELVEVFG